MVSNDVQDELAEGFEPSPLPPVGPDGALELPPMGKPPRHPPRLCEQGPCRNYHTFKIQLDAAKPLPVRREDGSMELPEAPDHDERHHYCYPAVGIESKLGGLPVIQCNRWSPMTAQELADDEKRLDEWRASDAGKAYLAELQAYSEEQQRLEQEAAAAAEMAADDLAAMPAPTITLRIVVPGEMEASGDVELQVEWGQTMRWVRDTALSEVWRKPPDQVERYLVHVAITPPNVFRARRLELDATASQCGLGSGDLIVLTVDPLSPDPQPKEPTP